MSLYRWALNPLSSSNYKMKIILLIHRQYSEDNFTEL